MAGRPLRKTRGEEWARKQAADPKMWQKRLRPKWGENSPVVAKPITSLPEEEGLVRMAQESNAIDAADVLAGDNRDLFKQLLDLSMSRSLDIMRLTLDPDDKNFPKLLASQESIARSIFSITARINDTELRKQQNDRIGALLAKVRDGTATETVSAEQLLS